MVNKRNKWCLSLGCIGRDMSYTLVSLFLLTYLQYTGLFNTEQFIALSAIIVVCRIWDAVNDPMMGTIITNTRTRFGKYRPWVIIGAVTNVVMLIGMFCVRTDNGWLNVAIIGVLYLLWGMTFTMNDISYWDLLPALTSEKKERDNLTALVAVFASVGAFAAGGIVPMVTPGNMILAYRIIAIITGVIFLGCQIMVFFGVHDNKDDTFIEKDFKRESKETKKEDTVSLKGMVKILFGNKQLLVMAVVVLLYTTASSMLTAFGQNFFYFKFGYLDGAISGKFGGGTLVTIFTVVFAAGTLISQAIYPTLAAKFKRDKLVFWSILVSVIGYALFFLLTTFLEGVVLFVLLCAFSLVIFAGQGVFYLTMLVMLTNTIEYGEWQTGKNHAAITFTVRPFMVKLSSALQYGVVVLTLILCGVYSITNQVGEVEVALGMLQEGKSVTECVNYLVELGHDATKIAQGLAEGALKAGEFNMDPSRLGLQLYCETLFIAPDGALVGMALMMSVVPMLCLIGSYLLIKNKYIISEEKYDEILKELEARKVEVSE